MNENVTASWDSISRPHQEIIKLGKRLGILDKLILLKRLLLDPGAEQTNSGRIIDLYEKPLNLWEKQISVAGSDKNTYTLVVGDIAGFDKGICHYLNMISDGIKDTNFLLLSEAETSNRKIDFELIVVPDFLIRKRNVQALNVIATRKTYSFVDCHRASKWCALNYLGQNKDLLYDDAVVWTYYSYRAAEYILDQVKPRQVIIWNMFYDFHQIVDHLCRKKSIPTVYMEFGSLPGTFSLETVGQMGQSYPGRFADEFMNLPVSESDLLFADRVQKYLFVSRINRNTQPQNDNIDRVKERLKKDRPTVLFAGCNDYESGIYPYTKETRQHSPIFKSSEDALSFLSDMAKKNNWNIIYKPHPIMIYLERVGAYGEEVIRIDDVDINELIDISDVVVTIVSQVSYISLIREKPVCMLGYTQLRGKGCTYEAFTMNDVEPEIQEAIKKGFSKSQKEMFRKHIAQMLKYNLYDDLTDKEMQYGQSVKDAVLFLEKGLSGKSR